MALNSYREIDFAKFRLIEDESFVAVTDEPAGAYRNRLEGHYDAFGRVRISNPFTIFDNKQLNDNQPLFWDDQETSGSGTSSTHDPLTASSVLAVSSGVAGTRVRQTFQRFNYQPGKSQLIYMTGTLDKSGSGTGITTVIGPYNGTDGLFFRMNEGTPEVVLSSGASGSTVENVITQASWNIDTMDGSGLSGLTIDFTKSQIFSFDYEWLGVGRARIGVVIGGILYYVHEFNSSNINTGVYMSTPNLPLRYSIDNDGTGGAAELEAICSTVISEGGVSKLGILRHTDSGSLSGLTAGSSYAVLGIRLKSSYTDITVLLESLSALVTTNDTAHWELRFNPTVDGTFTYSDATNSAVQIATGSSSNTITGGTEIDGGYFAQALPVTTTVPNALRLGAAIDGTVDEIVLIAKPISNNVTLEVSLTWRELN